MRSLTCRNLEGVTGMFLGAWCGQLGVGGWVLMGLFWVTFLGLVLWVLSRLFAPPRGDGDLHENDLDPRSPLEQMDPSGCRTLPEETTSFGRH